LASLSAIFAHLADLLVTGPKEGDGIGQALPQVFGLGLASLESRLKGLPLSLQGKGFALELGSAFLGLRHRCSHVDASLVESASFIGVRGIGLFQRQAPDDGEHLVSSQ
jgi:hypothetical protein